MTWTRDNGALAVDNPLSAGPLADLIRGNALHMAEQCGVDITTPLCGASVPGDGIVITPGTSGHWVGAFTQLRPFPIPIKYNADGSYREIQVTLDYYWTGHAFSEIKLICTNWWVPPTIVNNSSMWVTGPGEVGLVGTRFRNYHLQDLPAGVGAERTMTFSVTPETDDVSVWYPHKEAGRDGGETVPTALVTWLLFDVRLILGSGIKMRVIRIKDVAA